ncbi:uncharacterized protein LOC105219987 isoform X4 [Zeugodacus cucurbitae]|uniref:Ribonuclease P protein component 4 n=1 Tax=Zeugodacus cucurbitae TaxID=28588 RepID=A0A0A1WKS1_ZEUCU|nr:uncharacterized protein LOC105219987 isoform X4 [Zeugodacus cucurbitae]
MVLYECDMASLKLTQLHLSEVKQDISVEYVLTSGENLIALQCSSNQLIILDLLDSSSELTDLPYNLYYVEVPQSYNLAPLKKNNLKKSFNGSNLLEQHRRLLEPSYVSTFSCEPLKIIALQFKRAPWNTPTGESVAVIITNSGLCRIVIKMSAPSRHWNEICNVNAYFSNETLISKIKGFTGKPFIGCYITAAAWHKKESILFVSIENGYIATILFRDVNCINLEDICITKISLKKICDINLFDRYMLISTREGILQIFTLNLANDLPIITPLEYLWNKKDNIVCSKVLANKFTDSTYLVVFNKGPHILVYSLNIRGEVMHCKELYIGGIKVTGIQFVSSTDFIVTTTTNNVSYFRINFKDERDFKIIEQSVETEFNTSNVGILGIVPTKNLSVLTFILFRAGEYTQQCKYMHNSIFINIGKIEGIGDIEQSAMTNKCAIDCNTENASILGMHIFNNMEYENYCSLSDIINIQFPAILDKSFLLQLQMKFVFVSNFLSYQRFMEKKNQETTAFSLKFISISIQITHVICRLKYLFSLKAMLLTEFQKESIHVFLKTYIVLIRKLGKLLLRHNFVEKTKERFLIFFKKEYDINTKNSKINIAWKERCLYCQDLTNPDTMLCDRSHKVKRCYISYVQLPTISSRYCHRCQYYVLEDVSLLQQLYSENEVIKCIFCHAVFVNDCI